MKLKEFVFTIYSILFVAVVVSCSQSNKAKSDNNDERKPATENASAPADEANLDFLKNCDGKYADEVQLFENKVFAGRLEKLIGADNFNMLSNDWTTRMPLEFRNDVFVAEGCKPHDCGANNYIVVYGFSNDVLYAGISSNEKIQTFSEDGTTSPKVEKWKPLQ